MPYKDKDQRTRHSKLYGRIWYQDHKEEVMERRKQRQIQIQKWYREYKRTLSCLDCGEDHPACLQFHHKNKAEKDFNIADVASRASSIGVLLREMDKCEVLCVNCHAKRHWNEMHKTEG